MSAIGAVGGVNEKFAAGVLGDKGTNSVENAGVLGRNEDTQQINKQQDKVAMAKENSINQDSNPGQGVGGALNLAA